MDVAREDCNSIGLTLPEAEHQATTRRGVGCLSAARARQPVRFAVQTDIKAKTISKEKTQNYNKPKKTQKKLLILKYYDNFMSSMYIVLMRGIDNISITIIVRLYEYP